MKQLILIVLLVQSLVLMGQEIDIPINIQREYKFTDTQLTKILDSIALINIPRAIDHNNINYSGFENIHKSIDSTKKANENARLRQLFGDYDSFKSKFLALELKDETIDLHLPFKHEYDSRNPNYDYTCGGLVFTGPVSSIYNIFSKEVQSLYKHQDLTNYEPSQRIINKKYNKDKVQEWTKLNDHDLTKFVLYCNFDDTFLLKCSEYELVRSVLNKLTEFQALSDSANYKN
jgi:hypothetical protein